MSEALRLADDLDEFHNPSKDHASYAAQQAAAELRRLHAENEATAALNAELVEALNALLNDVGRANSMLGAVKARAALAKVEASNGS